MTDDAAELRVEHKLARLQSAFGEDAAIDLRISILGCGTQYQIDVGPDCWHPNRKIGEYGGDLGVCVDRLIARRWEIEARFGK